MTPKKRERNTSVLVTRSRRGPGRLRRRLESRGFKVVSVPTISFRPVESEWDKHLLEPDEPWDFTVFTSRTTLDFLTDRRPSGELVERRRNLGTIASVGRSTAAKLEELGLASDVVPEDFDAEGLLDALKGHIRKGARVAIPRAADARELLPDTLEEWGAHVTVIPIYEAYRPSESVQQLQLLGRSDVDIITFASSKTVENFESLLDESTSWLRELPAACIGPITRGTAESLGYAVLESPAEASFDGLVKVVEGWADSRESSAT
jgi:uroporphyrinogen III methyltransferase/synthase